MWGPRGAFLSACPLLLAGLLAGGCSTGGTPATGDRPQAPPRWLDGGTGVSLRVSGEGSVAETTVEVAPEAVWRVLPEVYDALGLGGGVVDAGARRYGNPEFTARRLAGSRTETLFRCANQGAGPSAMSRYRVRFSITTTVSDAGTGAALLTTDVVATGRPWEGTSSGVVICTSRGELEAAIERGVLERVGAAGG